MSTDHVSKASIAIGLLLFFSVRAAAQVDQCSYALTETGRNRLLQVNQSEREAYFYKKICESTQSGGSLDTAGEYFEVAKGNLGFNYSTARQFCEANQSKYRDYKFDYLQTSTVVEAALKSWVECLRINREGITVTPKLFKERAVISFERTKANAGIIRGVDATAETKCSGQLVNKGQSQFVALSKATAYQLPIDEIFTLTCDRTPQSTTGPVGSKLYPRTIVTVGTSAGPFSIEMEAEPLGPEQWASEVAKNMKALETQMATLNASLTKLSTDLSNLPIMPQLVDCAAISDWTTYAANSTLACPNGRVFGGLDLAPETFGQYSTGWRVRLRCCTLKNGK